MVRAILEGRKTQTRRVVKNQPPEDVSPIVVDRYHPTVILRNGEEAPGEEIFGAYSDDGDWGSKCPYGAPGDRLWVRETHDVNRLGVETFPDGCERFYAGIAYKADDGRHEADITERLYRTLDETESRGWTASIHMPRWASRITLEITGVRVERLNDISEADAANEGLYRLPALGRYVVQKGEQYFGGADRDARVVFADLWDRINGGGAWDANPWVWVVEFKRIEA